MLGAGGLGSHVVQHLVGLGIGRLTIVDYDVVDTRNFARQFTYTPAQLGMSKVEQVANWVRSFDPAVCVRPRHLRIESADMVTALLDGVDLVVAAIDQPEGVDLMVNQACVAAGVPYIRGGLAYLQGVYWSVDPGRSACRQCLETRRTREIETHESAQRTWPEILRRERVNRAIGPVAGMLGSLVAMEAHALSDPPGTARSRRRPTSWSTSGRPATSPPTTGHRIPTVRCAPPLPDQ